ncbi:hypothetical protein [Dactylosporangium sp. NPDC049140]|uniref:hypothetical protein n=1 Tax=Dactylosporangium sp. NPDC049140 TaxID=3155647 RepID=UPI003404B3F0
MEWPTSAKRSGAAVSRAEAIPDIVLWLRCSAIVTGPRRHNAGIWCAYSRGEPSRHGTSTIARWHTGRLPSSGIDRVGSTTGVPAAPGRPLGSIMAADVTVALITGGVAIAVSLASFPLSYMLGKRARLAQTQDLVARYRDPLLWAVHDLRSRIRTILDEEFLQRYLIDGDDFMRPYARRHTAFVLAQYLGWVEILRSNIGFLDLGDRRSNRKVVELLSIIRRCCSLPTSTRSTPYRPVSSALSASC